MKKYSRQDQRQLAAWASDCAERVLPLFEIAFPEDERPREAIESCRAWVSTGAFDMKAIRGASLSSHAAARSARENSAACFSARSAGQAVATAHVPQHAFGACYYALKAVAAAHPEEAAARVEAEWDWQVRRVSKDLREEVLKRVLVQRTDRGVSIKIDKGTDF
jgi:hypothetical protein